MALTQNFPQPPGRFNRQQQTFPEDLIQSNRGFYTNISLMDYDYSLVSSGIGAISYGGGFKLPIPKRLNDNEVILWEEWSASSDVENMGTNALQGIAGGSWGQAVLGGLTMGKNFAQVRFGQTINPFMFMMFRRPGFKEFTLSWTLAPNNEQESDTLQDIIKQCKRAALPSAGSVWGLQKYPKIALVSFKPDQYLFKLKPCAIISVQADYAGAGVPSFFKNGAPTVVNFTMQLKEIQLWQSTDPELQ